MKKLLVLILAVASTIINAKPVKQSIPTASIIYSIDDNRIISSINESTEVSIASMTKLVTVLTVLNSNQSLSETISVRGTESSPRIRKGMQLTRYDLIELSMVSSDNLAARTLVEHFPGGFQAGVDAINRYANSIGAKNTTIVEPTGLYGANKSTMLDMVKVTQETAKFADLFARFANLKESEVRAERVGRTTRIVQWIIGRTTNPFANEYKPFEIQAFKTGFTSAAGWCLTMSVKYNQRQYVIITAGNPTKQARKVQADQLIQTITNQQYRIEIADLNPQP